MQDDGPPRPSFASWYSAFRSSIRAGLAARSEAIVLAIATGLLVGFLWPDDLVLTLLPAALLALWILLAATQVGLKKRRQELSSWRHWHSHQQVAGRAAEAATRKGRARQAWLAKAAIERDQAVRQVAAIEQAIASLQKLAPDLLRHAAHLHRPLAQLTIIPFSVRFLAQSGTFDPGLPHQAPSTPVSDEPALHEFPPGKATVRGIIELSDQRQREVRDEYRRWRNWVELTIEALQSQSADLERQRAVAVRILEDGAGLD